MRNSYKTGLDILGHGGGHGGGGHGGHGGHGGGHGRGGSFGPGWWGGWGDAPDGYLLIDETEHCDLRGPNGECYQRVDGFGYDSSVHAMTLRDAPIADQVYALQVAAAKTGSPSLIQAGKDLQTALASWWSVFSTSGVKDQATELGKAIAKYTNGSDPLDGPTMAGGVASAAQVQVFDTGATGKVEAASSDVSDSASERVQDVKSAALHAKAYTENVANKANTTLIIVAVAVGLVATATLGTLAYKKLS